MQDEIIVIGGYGHVGQKICRELANQFPGKVYAAGRNLERAEAFSRTTNRSVLPLQLDVTKKLDFTLFKCVKLIVMCLDQNNTAFVEACLENRLNYIDISASYSFLSKVENLHKQAIENQATAVLSVGLSPGLTNLLALRAKNKLDEIDSINIAILLGLGDQHGKAAIEWTVDQLNKTYFVQQNGVMKEVSSFSDRHVTLFGQSIGRKNVYRFDFSDQHVLPRTLHVPTVSTRLCFDATIVTKLLALLKKVGLTQLLMVPFIRNTAIGILSNVKIGQEIFALKLDVEGKIAGKKTLIECFAQGQREAEITAKIATAIAKKLYQNDYLKGVYHIEQLFTLDDFLQEIRDIVAVEIKLG